MPDMEYTMPRTPERRGRLAGRLKFNTDPHSVELDIVAGAKTRSARAPPGYQYGGLEPVRPQL